jgi:nicotinate dehydrogenase subunit A
MPCAAISGCTGPASAAGSGNAAPAPSTSTAPSVRSCITPIAAVESAQKIVTLEGLGTPAKPHPVQKAFIDEQTAQCGYCINGMVMQAAAFLAKNKRPSEADIKNALAENLCRCGTHARIVRAVKRAAAQA